MRRLNAWRVVANDMVDSQTVWDRTVGQLPGHSMSELIRVAFPADEAVTPSALSTGPFPTAMQPGGWPDLLIKALFWCLSHTAKYRQYVASHTPVASRTSWLAATVIWPCAANTSGTTRCHDNSPPPRAVMSTAAPPAELLTLNVFVADDTTKYTAPSVSPVGIVSP